MPRPEFADMLVNRRRQLGLSIAQASQVLRLKEQVLVAFEEGDFERIPKSGYAQGMLSSYARYLGLNSRDVVRTFSRDLDRYLASNPGIDQSAESNGGGTGDVTRRQVSTFGTTPYVASRGLLPTSGGPAGDMGAFATTSQPHSRMQQSSYSYEGSEARQEYGYTDGDYAHSERRYTSRQPSSSRSATGARSLSRYGDARYSDAGVGGRGGADPYGRDQVTTRRVSPSQYTDDLRYDDDASPYEAASTSAGRRSYRNIATAERPQGGAARTQQRSQNRRRAQDARRRNRNGSASGIAGVLSNSSNLLVLVGAVLAVALTVIIILSVQSCVANRSGASEGSTVPVAQADTSSVQAQATASTTSATSSTSSAATTSSSAAAATSASAATASDATTSAASSEVTSSKKQAAQETKVVVSVESGAVSWVDIQLDGESVVADTITGPWSETYDVKEAISVEVGNTTAVTVTENGTRRQFDTKVSGIGSISIQGPGAAKTATGNDDKNSSSSSATSAGSDGSTSSTSSTSSSSDATTKTDQNEKKGTAELDTSVDEYLYEFNGYDIYYNEAAKLYYFIDENGVARNASDGTAI